MVCCSVVNIFISLVLLHNANCRAGTGLLSMMAARAMGHGDSVESSGSKGIVTACESYLPMVKLMRKVLHANGMQRKIRIINKRSDELEVGVDMPSRADMLVSTLAFFNFIIYKIQSIGILPLNMYL